MNRSIYKIKSLVTNKLSNAKCLPKTIARHMGNLPPFCLFPINVETLYTSLPYLMLNYFNIITSLKNCLNNYSATHYYTLHVQCKWGSDWVCLDWFYFNKTSSAQFTYNEIMLLIDAQDSEVKAAIKKDGLKLIIVANPIHG